MKIRYIFILMVLVLMAGLTTTYNYVKISENTDIDMAEYNDKFQIVSNYLDSLSEFTQESKAIKDAGKKYKCSIYLTNDEFYKMNVNNAIKHQDVIFDYFRMLYLIIIRMINLQQR